MGKEFCLSEKEFECDDEYHPKEKVILISDIQEFIKILKEGYSDDPKDEESLITIPIHALDKLVGKKLV